MPSFTVSFPWAECSAFSATKAIHTILIFVPPDAHYCWVTKGGVQSAIPRLLHITSGAGIEPQTPSSRVNTYIRWKVSDPK